MRGTFGIELESYGLTIEEASNAILSIDDSLRFKDNSHTHNGATFFNGKTWQAMADGSLKDQFGNRNMARWNNRGTHEIVSPVLKGRKGMNDALKVIRALNTAGAKVNSTCGLHVTFGLDNTRWQRMSRTKQSQKLYRLCDAYSYFQEVINSMLAPSRRNTGYASTRIPTGNPNNFLNQYHTKYTAVNISTFTTRHVVEFRQHQGTMNARKVREWTQFLSQLLTFTVNEEHSHKEVRDFPQTFQGMIDCFAMNEAQARFWSRRIAQLSGVVA
jgi:hypothetical protein